MRSFLSRCSLILSLVCTLTVASQGVFTVRSVKNDHCVSKHGIARGHDITAVSCHEAAHLRVRTAPNHHDRVVTTSFKSVDHDLYIGIEGKPESPVHLVWVPYEYKWQVSRQDDGKYLIGIDERHLYWFDAFPHDRTGPVQLVAPNVYTPLPTLVWDFDPVKY